MAKKILGSYPDYAKAPPEYILAVTQFIAYQLPEVQAALAHPTMGIATKCKYLPTIADLKQFLEDRAKRLNTRSTTYRLLKRGEGDPKFMLPAERRRAQVLEELGYDPMTTRGAERPPLPIGISEAIKEGRWSSADLKTPARPASAELKELITRQTPEQAA